MDKFSKPEQFDAAVEIHGGEPFAVWAPAVNGSHVKAELYFALQHESAVNWEAATSLVAENEELKRALEAKDKRIAELEAIRADASQVFKEIGSELGCNTDNESLMIAIDELKSTQMTGPLKDVLKRNIELEAKLATPVRVPSPAMFDEDDSAETVISVTRARLRAQGFKVATDGATTVGDE